MSEFNTGKPPAGEAGMCITKDESLEYAQYWSGNYFAPYADDGCFEDAFGWRSEESLYQDHAWRWATIAELTTSGIPESDARGMVHKSMLPEAAADAEWGPWIFCEEGSKCPIPGVKAGGYAVRWSCGGELTSDPELWFGNVWDAERFWECAAGDFAYRLKLEDKPTTAEVEATQKPQSPEDFVRDMYRDEEAVMATDQNEAMKNRDALKRAITPPTKDEGWREYDPKYPPIQPYRMDFKTVVEGEHVRHFYRRADTSAVDVVLYARNGLIIVAPWTNRLGGNWGAFE